MRRSTPDANIEMRRMTVRLIDEGTSIKYVRFLKGGTSMKCVTLFKGGTSIKYVRLLEGGTSIKHDRFYFPASIRLCSTLLH